MNVRSLIKMVAQQKLNVISLEADGHKLQCTLFGPYVDELNTFVGAGDVTNVVVIAQLAKAKTFQGNILRRRMILDQHVNCVLCGAAMETSLHLFLHCRCVAKVWYDIMRWLGLIVIIPPNLATSFAMLLGCAKGKRVKAGLTLVWHSFMWVIWKHRNDCVFNNKEVNMEEMRDQVKLVSWKWFISRMAKGLCLLYEWNWSPFDCKNSVTASDENPSPLTFTQLSVESSVQPLDEFLYNTPGITLQTLKDATTESSHVVVATVKRSLNPDAYWYTACLGGKVVIPDSRMWYCEKCNKHVPKVVPRFCVKVRVIDHTDSTTFVIFDKEASCCLRKRGTSN